MRARGTHPQASLGCAWTRGPSLLRSRLRQRESSCAVADPDEPTAEPERTEGAAATPPPLRGPRRKSLELASAACPAAVGSRSQGGRRARRLASRVRCAFVPGVSTSVARALAGRLPAWRHTCSAIARAPCAVACTEAIASIEASTTGSPRARETASSSAATQASFRTAPESSRTSRTLLRWPPAMTSRRPAARSSRSKVSSVRTADRSRNSVSVTSITTPPEPNAVKPRSNSNVSSQVAMSCSPTSPTSTSSPRNSTTSWQTRSGRSTATPKGGSELFIVRPVSWPGVKKS
jgi:hypothetical protein